MLNVLLGLLLSAIPLPAKPTHYVTDNAGVLTAERAAKLDQKLEQFEKRTSDQVIVYIDKKMPAGSTLEEMSAQAIREWGVGQKKKNNGVILFVFTEQRKMKIEVGYGLEGSLTDAKSKLITSTIMKPRLREGDYAGAVEHGVEAILNTIGTEEYQGNGRTVAEADAGHMSASDIVIAIFFLVALPLILIGSIIAFIVTLIRNPRAAWSRGSSSSGSWSSSSDSSSFSDSGSSSGGDFSGGGGDGGGGGASDSW